ncbi:hypothetical protein INR49_001175 [Caranx melampygus]|nr:hypothetical protein INR49_001175 [Caranx melampygus]
MCPHHHQHHFRPPPHPSLLAGPRCTCSGFLRHHEADRMMRDRGRAGREGGGTRTCVLMDLLQDG